MEPIGNPLAEAAGAPSPVPACSLEALPARLAAAMAARQAHAARTVVLLPFGQLIAPARRAWAAHAPDGFSPRFETTLSWAARYGFSPDPLDLSFDRGLDLLTARGLLESAGLGGRAAALAPRLVESAWQLVPLAAAVPPAQRPAWARTARAAGGLGLEHPVMALEAALARIAIEWVAASAHLTDRLFSVEEAAAVDLLLVVEGLQPDPVARAIAAALGARAQCWALETEPPPGEIRLHPCRDPADEAERAAACVMRDLAEGREPVALAAVDRVLTRRIRALLAARGVRIADETGWKLSTTRAAAQLMSLLRSARWDAGSDDVLDWLKGVPAAAGESLRALERHLRREGRRQWSEVEGALAPGASGPALALCFQANAWRERLRQPRTLPKWQRALREVMQATGVWALLEADAAGRQLVAALGLDEAGEELWSRLPQAGRRLGLDELSAWAGEALEAASYLPEAPEQAQVVVLPFGQLLGRRFAALVVPGCDEVRLNASPEPPGPWTAAQRLALGLPSREALEAALRGGWRAALGLPTVDLLWRTSDDSGEPVLPSPLVQQLRGVAGVFDGEDPRARRPLAPAPVARPQPRAPHLTVRELSASAYGDLRRCPYRFFAMRQLGLQEAAEIDVELDKRDFGNWLHEVLHRFHEALAEAGTDDAAGRVALMDGAAQAATRRQGLPAADFLPFEAGWPQLRDGYLKALRAFERAQGARYDRGEQDAVVGLGPVRLMGRIDRIDRLADGTRVVMDYKTESLDTTRQRVKDPLEDTQLAFYAALLGDERLQAFYVNVGERGETHFLAQPDVETARAALVEGILEDLRRIGEGQALPALGDGSACTHCTARGLCRKDFWAE